MLEVFLVFLIIVWSDVSPRVEGTETMGGQHLAVRERGRPGFPGHTSEGRIAFREERLLREGMADDGDGVVESEVSRVSLLRFTSSPKRFGSPTRNMTGFNLVSGSIFYFSIYS
jgi:hypothetical protein